MKKIPINDRIAIVWDELRTLAEQEAQDERDWADALLQEKNELLAKLERRITEHLLTEEGQRELSRAEALASQLGIRVSLDRTDVRYTADGCGGLCVPAEEIFVTAEVGDLRERINTIVETISQQRKYALASFMDVQPARVRAAIKAELLRRDHGLVTADKRLSDAVRDRIAGWQR